MPGRPPTRWSGRRRWAFAAAIPVIIGVILNRLNVAWIGLLPWTGAHYVPSWIETTVTLNLVSVGVVIFGHEEVLAHAAA